MLSQYEVNHMENRMVVSSEWDSYGGCHEPDECEFPDEGDLFEEDMIDDFD